MSPCGFSSWGPLGPDPYNPPGRLGDTRGPLRYSNQLQIAQSEEECEIIDDSAAEETSLPHACSLCNVLLPSRKAQEKHELKHGTSKAKHGKVRFFLCS